MFRFVIMRFLLIVICAINYTMPRLVKKHVQNSICPNYNNIPTYDITRWVNRLQLQVCTIVEIGDLNAAIFIEDRSSKKDANSSVRSYFLGICDVETLSSWQLCGADLKQARPDDCNIDVLDFDKLTSSPRVHRRLCDLNKIARTQSRCKCAPTVSGYELYCVTGFPTCFLEPVPLSLCEHYSACGFGSCKASTVLGRIHVIECGPNCIGEQPFCEYPVGAKTSEEPKISSFWSEWEEASYESQGTSTTVRSVAKCINKFTNQGAIDCLGPGTNCCPKDLKNCVCHTYIEDGMLKVYRIYDKDALFNEFPNKYMYLEVYDNRMKSEPNRSLGKNFGMKLKKFEKVDHNFKMGNPLIRQPYDGAAYAKNANFNSATKEERAGTPIRRNSSRRHIRDMSDPDDVEDDDEDTDNLGDEDIAIEEVEDADIPASTSEEPEEDEMHALQQTEIAKELTMKTVLPDYQPNKTNKLIFCFRSYLLIRTTYLFIFKYML